MRYVMKLGAVGACLVLLAGAPDALASCTNFGPGFPIFQCTSLGWFGPKPAGAGPHSVVWWQVGYGNAAVSNGQALAPPQEGSSIAPLGVFNGNDSGMFNMVLSDARMVLDQDPSVSDATIQAIPAGSMCSNYENSWSQPGIDGCVDVTRTTADDNNKLNPQYYAVPDPVYYDTRYVIDYPMVVLIRESTGRFFAFAALANKDRGSNPDERAVNVTEGDFDMGTIIGEPNPAAPTDPRVPPNSQIPWQPVPKVNVNSAVINPVDQTRTLNVSWANVRQFSDQTTRPSSRLGLKVPGMGVRDMGSLVRYRLESAPVTTATPDPTTLNWTAVDINGGAAGTDLVADPNASTITLPPFTVPGDTALRLRTILGRNPVNPTNQTAAVCRLGDCGDRCIEATGCMLAACHNTITTNTCTVSPPLTIVGGSLISERAIEVRAAKAKGQVEITFRTTSEQTVTSIDVLGVSNRGDFVITSIAPQEGNTGIGASYLLNVPIGDLKGAKEIKVRLNGPNETTEPVPVE